MYVKTRPIGYSSKKFKSTKERKVKKSLIPQTIEVETSNGVLTKTIYHEPPQKKEELLQKWFMNVSLIC